MAADDTIVALASGPLPSAIALVRISGPDVRRIVRSFLTVPDLLDAKATLTCLQCTEGNRIDQVIATWFHGPRSYTGEDLLELGVHGGRAVVSKALEALTSLPDVRLAEPGEFTKRAVLSGKIDLLEAEGIADLVDAETEAQRKLAFSQLDGRSSAVFADWHRQLVEAMALVEVAVDFPDEEDAPDFTHGPVLDRLGKLAGDLDSAVDGAQAGMQIRDGVSIAIIGAPNAGKSTLLNRLAARDVAIVTDRPGTTRDVIEVPLNLGGYLVRLSDTAGLRDSDDPIETEGIRRAMAAAQEADLVLGVFDAAEEITPPEIFSEVSPDIIVASKADLLGQPQSVSRETLLVSAKTGEGIPNLLAELQTRIEGVTSSSSHLLVTRERHLKALTLARDSILLAMAGLESGMGAELVAEDLRLAGRQLEAVLGRVDVEDILGRIFSTFCIGK
ncbi:MAG: tRNA uridine-5-carboxymethylaminomethyl(34) synthesis GTPase MnmE [Pseudomonadota bacterium]